MALSSEYPPFSPPSGMLLWELGLESNAQHLISLLNTSKAEQLYVTSPETETQLQTIRNDLDSSSMKGANIAFIAVTDCSIRTQSDTVDRLKRVLALGVDPDSAYVDGRRARASHVASVKACVELAEVIGFCRPDLRVKAGSRGTPRGWASDVQKTTPDLGLKAVYKQINDLWVCVCFADLFREDF